MSENAGKPSRRRKRKSHAPGKHIEHVAPPKTHDLNDAYCFGSFAFRSGVAYATNKKVGNKEIDLAVGAFGSQMKDLNLLDDKSDLQMKLLASLAAGGWLFLKGLSNDEQTNSD